MTSRLGLLLAIACVAIAGNTPAELAGLIQDRTGSALVAASVTVMDQETGIRRSGQTDGEGAYQVGGLPEGLYKITVRKPGFQTVVQWNVPVHQGQDARLDFVMQVGSMREVITVEGTSTPLNADDGSVGTVMGRKAIEALPISGRGVMSLIELSPGVVATPASGGEAGQFSTNGLRANTNYFTVDGVSANTGVTGGGLPAQFAGLALPAMTAFGSTQNLVANDALDEVKVLTSSFAPQFGRLPGAQVALTTRSGSNEYHGSAFYWLRNGALDANDWFANAYAAAPDRLRLNQWGGTVGGPVRRDRTFFFGSYESMRLEQPYTLLTVTPSLDARAAATGLNQLLLNAFPLPNGALVSPQLSRLVESFARPARLNSESLRIDHTLNDRVTLFGRYNRAPSSTQSGFNQIEGLQLSATSFTAGFTAMPSGGVTNDWRLNVWSTTAQSQWTPNLATGGSHLDLANILPRPLNPGSVFFGAAVGGVGTLLSGVAGENRQRQWNLVDTLGISRKNHNIRLGIDYERLTPTRDSAANSVVGTWFTLAQAVEGTPAFVTTSHADQASGLIETLSAFLQDTWSLSSRLTLTYGVRWEITPPPAVRDPGASTTIAALPPPNFGNLPYLPVAPTTETMWHTRYTQIAPRVGAAFRVDDNSVVRAGWGKYYDLGFSTALDPINGFPFNRWQFSGQGTPGGSVAAGSYGAWVAPDLTLPYVYEWNVAYERMFGLRNVLSISYVGSSGNRLLRYEGILQPNTHLAQFAVATNHGESNSHGLELHYRRRLARGVQGSLAYTWSHSIDNGSWDSGFFLADPTAPPLKDRASSSFDVRHNLTASLSYAIPGAGHGMVQKLTSAWQFSGVLRARSGFPIDVLTTENLLGLGFDDVGRPDLVPGVPVWISGGAIGGRSLNPAAFAAPKGLQGNLGRNAITGQGMWQVDLALRRAIPLSHGTTLELGLDAYNALNHTNPADPVRFLDSPYFGTPISMLNLMLGSGNARSGLAPAFQIGGARSFQLSARIRF